MITTLSLVFDKENNRFQPNCLPKKCKEYYIREEPSKVIAELKDDIIVCSFNRISTNYSQTLKIGPDKYLGGVAVNYLHSAKDSCELKNVKTFINSLPPILTRLPNSIDILENLISIYLTDIQVESNGYMLSGSTYLDVPKTDPKILSPGIQNVINYMDTRQKVKDFRREMFLKDIITYGKGIIDKDFCENDVKDISERLSLKISTVFNPSDGPLTFRRSTYR